MPRWSSPEKIQLVCNRLALGGGYRFGHSHYQINDHRVEHFHLIEKTITEKATQDVVRKSLQHRRNHSVSPLLIRLKCEEQWHAAFLVENLAVEGEHSEGKNQAEERSVCVAEEGSFESVNWFLITTYSVLLDYSVLIDTSWLLCTYRLRCSL